MPAGSASSPPLAFHAEVTSSSSSSSSTPSGGRNRRRSPHARSAGPAAHSDKDGDDDVRQHSASTQARFREFGGNLAIDMHSASSSSPDLPAATRLGQVFRETNTTAAAATRSPSTGRPAQRGDAPKEMAARLRSPIAAPTNTSPLTTSGFPFGLGGWAAGNYQSHGSPFPSLGSTGSLAGTAASLSPTANGSNEELWVSIERYLLAACSALHGREESELRPLKTPKHRMGWYAVVYNACNGNPANSRELYARLALAIFHTLEVFVLYPMLQHADRSRLELITGREPSRRAASSSAGSVSASVGQDGTKRSATRNGSFRLLRRLLFRSDDAHGGSSAHPGSAHEDASAAQSLSQANVTSLSSDKADAVLARDSSFSVTERADSSTHAETPGEHGAVAAGETDAPPRAASGRQASGQLTRAETNSVVLSVTPVPSPVPSSAASARLVARDSSTDLASHSCAIVSAATGRVVLDEDEEELPLPESTQTPPEVLLTVPSTPAPLPPSAGESESAAVTRLSSRLPLHAPEDQQRNHTSSRTSSRNGDRGTRATSSAALSTRAPSDSAPYTAEDLLSQSAGSTAATPVLGAAASTPHARSSPPTLSDTETGEAAQKQSAGPHHPHHNHHHHHDQQQQLQQEQQRQQRSFAKSHYSACRTFDEEYATFAIFRRVVLSCFRYLDQYYTRRFGMDTLTVMCVKLFYVVVYEPVKPLLMDELFTVLHRVRVAQREGRTSFCLPGSVSTRSPEVAPTTGMTPAAAADGESVSLARSAHGGEGYGRGMTTATTTPAPATVESTEQDTELNADVTLIQETVAVITELIVTVQSTSSYLVEGVSENTGSSAGPGSSIASSAATGPHGSLAGSSGSASASTAAHRYVGSSRQRSPARGPSVLRAALASTSSPLGLADSAASTVAHRSLPSSPATSAASTPRYRSLEVPAGPALTPSASALSPQQVGAALGDSGRATAAPPPAESRRSRFFRLLRRRSSPRTDGTTGAPADASTAPQSTQQPHSSLNGSTTSDAGLPALSSAAASYAGSPAATGQRAKDASTNAVSGEGGGSLAMSFDRDGSTCSCTLGVDDAAAAASTAEAATPPAGVPRPLMVDLRGTMELQDRLESRSLAFSLASQAQRHSELYGSSAGGAGGGSLSGSAAGGSAFSSAVGGSHAQGAQASQQQQQQQQPLTGTIIREIGQPLGALIGDDVGNRYVEVMELFYREERPHRTATVDARRGYVHWVRGVFALERYLLRDVGASFPHGTVHAVLARVLLTEVHREIVLDAESGFRRLLDAWDGSRPNDEFIARVLGEGNPTGTSGFAAKKDLGTGEDGSRVKRGADSARTGSLLCSGARSQLTETSDSFLDSVQSSNMTSGVYGTRLTDIPEESARAVGVYFTTFIQSNDENCVLLLAAVLASKVIADCAEAASTYLRKLGATPDAAGNPMSAPLPGAYSCRAGPRKELTTDAVIAAGNVFAGELVDIAMLYSRLVQTHIHGNVSLYGALGDALAEVLNPARWICGGAIAASEARVRGAALAVTGERKKTNVLLSRDAGAKATQPLNALAAAVPLATKISMPILLAAYCDHLCSRKLMGPVVGDSSASVQDRLTQVSYFISLLDQKDVFLEYYRERLARRLLSTAVNMDAERWLVQQLQMRLGANSVHAFEAMLRDSDTSAAISSTFEQTESFHRLRIPIRVQLLSSAQWPSYPTTRLQPHRTLAVGMRAFEEYYLRLHPSRTLRWHYLLGSAHLTAEFPLGNKDITANHYQATILLLLSDACNQTHTADSEPRSSSSSSSSSSDARPRSSRHAQREGDEQRGGLLNVLPRWCHGTQLEPERVGTATREESTVDDPLAPPKVYRSDSTDAASASAEPSQGNSGGLASLLVTLTTTAISSVRRANLVRSNSNSRVASVSPADKDSHADPHGSSSSGTRSSSGRSPSRSSGQHRRSAKPSASAHAHASRRDDNAALSLTGQQLADRMGVSFADLRPHLGSLTVLRGFRLLVRAAASTADGQASASPGSAFSSAATVADLSPTDHFTLNAAFSHSLRRLRLPAPRTRRQRAEIDGLSVPAAVLNAYDGEGAIAAVTTAIPVGHRRSPSHVAAGAAEPQGNGGTTPDIAGEPFGRVQDNVSSARCLQLDAAIVRLMKSHKALPYQRLFSLVTQQVSGRFLPSSKDIKTRVEQLMERGFVARSTEDQSIIVYIA